MEFKFQKLIVWQKSLELSLLVHNVAMQFPKYELFGLASQIKRAADSVSLNIAEGSTGQTDPELNRFLRIALRSDIEVVGCIYIAQKRNMINDENFQKIYSMCEDILAMIYGLMRSLRKR